MSYFTGRISRYPLLPEESVAKRMRVRKKLISDDPVWEVRDSQNINTATTAEVSQAYRSATQTKTQQLRIWRSTSSLPESPRFYGNTHK